MIGIIRPPLLKNRRKAGSYHHGSTSSSNRHPRSSPSSTWSYYSSFLTGYAFCHGVNVLLTYMIISSTFMFQNSAIQAMAFYGVYHRDPINQMIHFVGVPGIIYSLLLFQCHLDIIPSSMITLRYLPGIPAHAINWATIWFMVYVIFYINLDWYGASLYLPILYMMYASSVRSVQWDRNQTKDPITNQQQQQQQQQPKEKIRNDSSVAHHGHQPSSLSNGHNIETTTTNWMGSKRLLWMAGMIQIVSWYVQIHFGHYIYEGAQPAVLQSIGGALTTAPLFAFYEFIWYLGYRQEFHQAVLHQVNIYTETLCQQGLNMRVCSNL
jgi:uncharacterized membrane protein YGL010W